MRRKQASELIKLVHGEGGVIWPSRLERKLLKFALDTFGEMLSQFIFTGLGQKKVGQGWHLAISYISEEGAVRKRHVQVITHEPANGQSSLPRGRDPLVLLALLQLLMHRRQAKPTLFYSHEEVLKLLGWENTEESRQEIDRAVDHYSLLMYQWEMNRYELESRNLSHCRANERMISKYQMTDQEARADREMIRVSNWVIFNEFFIDGLLRRTLFDVEWGKVRSIKFVQPLRERR